MTRKLLLLCNEVKVSKPNMPKPPKGAQQTTEVGTNKRRNDTIVIFGVYESEIRDKDSHT
ncbi:hypothetical protein X798_05467 [Onchocerca flexuosa]|uniref:Uncharacterized protein n=1 Tax=Onchocerca flexuosa TaxID=387005 RepID=A0A238BRP0_9BILA|nr:hypothetical protein X798_05467 [Onchocerca flexuosa]